MTPAQFVDRLFAEPDLGKRADVGNQALNGLPAPDAIGLLFDALNLAVDHARVAIELLVAESSLDGPEVLRELHRRQAIRSAEYRDYQTFRKIVEGLGRIP